MSEPVDNPELEPEPEPEENEVLRAAREAKEARVRAGQSQSQSQSGKKGINWKTAAAAGLGSAAIIAALIYSQRDKNDDD